MTKSRKLLLGLLTLLPIVLLVIYLASFISMFFSLFSHGNDEEYVQHMMFTNFAWIMALALLMTLVALGLLVYYIVHAINNERLVGNERIVWILLFIFLGIVGMPVYWYMRIWKADDAPRAGY